MRSVTEPGVAARARAGRKGAAVEAAGEAHTGLARAEAEGRVRTRARVGRTGADRSHGQRAVDGDVHDGVAGVTAHVGGDGAKCAVPVSIDRPGSRVGRARVVTEQDPASRGAIDTR